VADRDFFFLHFWQPVACVFVFAGSVFCIVYLYFFFFFLGLVLVICWFIVKSISLGLLVQILIRSYYKK
jgi:hypothetical protein